VAPIFPHPGVVLDHLKIEVSLLSFIRNEEDISLEKGDDTDVHNNIAIQWFV